MRCDGYCCSTININANVFSLSDSFSVFFFFSVFLYNRQVFKESFEVVVSECCKHDGNRLLIIKA